MSLVMVGLASGQGHAEDVYNFYFQKSPKGKKLEEKSEEAKSVPVAEEENYVEEIMEVDDDVLLVPDNWRPAGQRYKKVYVRKPKTVYVEKKQESSISTKVEEPKKERNYRGWSASLGIGSMKAEYDGSYGMWPSRESVSQKTYVLGAVYHMSKYFEVNGELHLPNGDTEGDLTSSYEANNVSMNSGRELRPQGFIGLGVTPIHLKVFGSEFLAIGVDGGVGIGNSNIGEDSSSRVYLGPRLAMNFSDHFSLKYSAKFAVNTDYDFDTYSLSLVYRW